MGESNTVDALLFMQEIDAKIGLDMSQVSSLRAELEALEAQVDALQAKEGGLRGSVEESETRFKACERTVKAGRETLKRLQQRAQEVKNMKQHLAVRNEVERARSNLDLADEESLESLQLYERSKTALEEHISALTEASVELADRKAEIEMERGRLEEEIAIQTDRRENRAARVHEGVRGLYEQVRRGRTGSALAPVLDGVCGHCFMAIPKQRQAEIKAGRALVVCEACGVILHLPKPSSD